MGTFHVNYYLCPQEWKHTHTQTHTQHTHVHQHLGQRQSQAHARFNNVMFYSLKTKTYSNESHGQVKKDR